MRRALFASGLLFVAGLLCVWLFWTAGGARRDESLIVRPGIYRSPNAQWELHVSLDAKNDVRFAVIDRTTGRHLVDGNAGRTFERWAFMWDSTGRLWTYGEQADSAYVPDSCGGFVEVPVEKDSEIIKHMPESFRRYLPHVLQRHLGFE